jgi:hypothetical protein
MVDDPLAQLSIRGGHVVIIAGTVFAALLPPPHPATWLVTTGAAGAVRFVDQASGFVLGCPTSAEGVRAVVAPADAGLAVIDWRLLRCADEDEDPDPSVVADPSSLVSGHYAIQDPSSGGHLSRDPARELSLRPEAVTLSSDPGRPELLIQVVG